MFGAPDFDQHELNLMRVLREQAKQGGLKLAILRNQHGQHFCLKQRGRVLYQTHDLQAVRDWLAA